MRCHIFIIPFNSNHINFAKEARRNKIIVIAIDDNLDKKYIKNVDYYSKINSRNINKLNENLIKKSSIPIGIIGLNSDFGIKMAIKLSIECKIKCLGYFDKEFKLIDKYFYLNKFNNSINTFKIPPKDKFFITKPRFGSGSKQIFLNTIKDKDFIYQLQFKGNEYSVEGINFYGRAKVVCVSRRFMSNFSAHTIKSLNPSGHTYNLIKNYFEKNIRFDNETFFPFHCELILKDDKIHLIDFSPRGGGFQISDKFQDIIYNINLNKILLNNFLGVKEKIETNNVYNPALIYFVKFEDGIFLNLDFDKTLLEKKDIFKILIKKNTIMNIPTNDSHRIAYFIISSNNSKKLEQKFKLLKKSIKILKK